MVRKLPVDFLHTLVLRNDIFAGGLLWLDNAGRGVLLLLELVVHPDQVSVEFVGAGRHGGLALALLREDALVRQVAPRFESQLTSHLHVSLAKELQHQVRSCLLNLLFRKDLDSWSVTRVLHLLDNLVHGATPGSAMALSIASSPCALLCWDLRQFVTRCCTLRKNHIFLCNDRILRVDSVLCLSIGLERVIRRHI